MGFTYSHGFFCDRTVSSSADSKCEAGARWKHAPSKQHDHLITDENHGVREYWDVYVVGVTNRAVYNRIHNHQPYGYIRSLIKHENKAVVGPPEPLGTVQHRSAMLSPRSLPTAAR